MVAGLNPKAVSTTPTGHSPGRDKIRSEVSTSRLLAGASAHAVTSLIDTVNEVLNPVPPLTNDYSLYDTLNNVIDLCKKIIFNTSILENLKTVISHNIDDMEFLAVVARSLNELIQVSTSTDKLNESLNNLIELIINHEKDQIKSKVGDSVFEGLLSPLKKYEDDIKTAKESQDNKRLSVLNNIILSQLNKIHTRLFKPIDSDDIEEIKSFLMTDIQNLIISYEKVVQTKLSSVELTKTLTAVKQELILLQSSPEITSSLVFLCSVKKILEGLDPTETNLLKKLDNKFIKILNENESDAAVKETFQAAKLYCRYYELKFDITNYQIQKIDGIKLISPEDFENIQSLPDNEQSMGNIIDCLENIFEISKHIKDSEFKSRHEQIYERLKQYVDIRLKNCNQGSISDEDLKNLKLLQYCFHQYKVTKIMSNYIDVENYIQELSKLISHILESTEYNHVPTTKLVEQLYEYFNEQLQINYDILMWIVRDFSTEKDKEATYKSISSTMKFIDRDIEKCPIKSFQKFYECIDTLIQSEKAKLNALKDEYNRKNDLKVFTWEVEEPKATTCDKKLRALEELYEYQLKIHVFNNRELLKELINTDESASITRELLDEATAKLQLDSLKYAITNNTLKSLNEELLHLINNIKSSLEKKLKKYKKNLIKNLTKLLKELEPRNNKSKKLEDAIAAAKSLLQSSDKYELRAYINQLKESISELTCLQELQKDKETKEQYRAQYETLTVLVAELDSIQNTSEEFKKAIADAKSFLKTLSETQQDGDEASIKINTHIATLTLLKEKHIEDLNKKKTGLIENIKTYLSELEQVPDLDLDQLNLFLNSLEKDETADIKHIKQLEVNITQLELKYKLLISLIDEKCKNYKNQVIDCLNKLAQLDTSHIKCKDFKELINKVQKTLEELDEENIDFLLLIRLKTLATTKLLDYCNFYEMQKKVPSVVPMPITSKSRVEFAYGELQKIVATLDSSLSPGESTDTNPFVGIINKLNRLNSVQAELKQRVEDDYKKVQPLLGTEMTSEYKNIVKMENTSSIQPASETIQSIVQLKNFSESLLRRLNEKQTHLTQTLSQLVTEFYVTETAPEELNKAIADAKSLLKTLSETQQNGVEASIQKLNTQIDKLTKLKAVHIEKLKYKQNDATELLLQKVTKLKAIKSTSEKSKKAIADAESFLNTLSETPQNNISVLLTNIKQLRKKIKSLNKLIILGKHNNLKQRQDHLKELLGQKLSALLTYFKNINIAPYEFIEQAKQYLEELNLKDIKFKEDNVVVNTKLEKFIKLAKLNETVNKYYVLLDIYQICNVHQNKGFYEIWIQAKQVLNNPNSDITSIQEILDKLNESIQWHQNNAQNILTQHKQSITNHIQFMWCSYQQNFIGFQQTNALIFVVMNSMINPEFQQLNNILNQLNALESSLKTQLQT